MTAVPRNGRVSGALSTSLKRPDTEAQPLCLISNRGRRGVWAGPAYRPVHRSSRAALTALVTKGFQREVMEEENGRSIVSRR
jgi:hypothetical protein